ncbi:hypothetical protein J6590_030307 [Homalodisca vitripennis]|nr:hypothetical protein J6590_030307 [Homalodisca vitripennis]
MAQAEGRRHKEEPTINFFEKEVLRMKCTDEIHKDNREEIYEGSSVVVSKSEGNKSQETPLNLLKPVDVTRLDGKTNNTIVLQDAFNKSNVEDLRSFYIYTILAARLINPSVLDALLHTWFI